ncbi:hypothetical protein [Saccharothrix deserti]|uniref:hypothetical protein n=1 Tax=Saccharothrix deserti TaxID=2593674 RepID=UPI00131A9671|nr:hypothetical protein [Saccharothrix deserti]
MDTESQIRDALRLRAEQTPPEGNVLAALYRPKKSRKPLFLSLAAATGAVAIAAVAVVTTANIRPSTEAGAQNTTVPTTTTAATNAPATLGYSPTWLPDGMIEGDRIVDLDDRTQRHWVHRVPNGQSDTPMFTLVIAHSEEGKQALHNRIINASGDSRATVNGKPAQITDPQQDATNPDAEVVLNPEPGVYIQLTLLNAPDVRASALRIAESLRPDPTPARSPMSIGGSVDYTVTVNGETHSEGKWSVSTSGEIDGVGYSATLSNNIAPELKGGYGTWVAVTARGLPAEYLATGNGYLRVELAPQRYLLVAGNGPDTKSAEALIAAAEAVEVDLNPDMSWIGR